MYYAGVSMYYAGSGRVARGADGNGRADGYVIIHNKINTYNEKL